MTEHPTQKRTLEDIAAVQSDQTAILLRIVERLDEHTTLLVQHSELLTRLVGRLDAQGTMLQHHSELLKTILARLPEQR